MMVLGGLGALAGAVSGETEKNDDFGSANLITSGTYTGNLTTSVDETDTYKFVLTAGQWFTANITVTAAGGASDTLKMKVYNTAMSYIDGTSWLANGLSEELRYTIGQTPADADNWYIQVDGGSNGFNNYSLKLAVYDQWDAGQLGDAGDTDIAPRAIVPGTYTGWLGDLDEEDYYNFTVPAGYTIKANLTVANQGTDTLKLSLHAPDKSYINSTSWLNPGISETVWHTTSHATGGNYYLDVKSGNNNYTFVLTLIPPDDVGSGTDVTDDKNVAFLLPGNGTYSGRLNDDDEADFYKFNLSAGQRFFIDLTVGIMDTGTAKLSVYKPDKNYLISTSWTNPGVGDSFNYTTNNAGTGQYYVLLEGENSYTFTILLEDQFDAGVIGNAGDDINTPRPIELNKWYSGWMADADDKDYYSFPCMANQKLTVNFTILNGANKGKVTVHDAAKSYIDSSSWVNSGLVTYVNVTQPTAGTGYLLVETDFANYTFNVSAPPDSEPPVLAITTPAQSAGFVTANITVTGTATDNVGVTALEYSLDNMTWANCTGTGTWSANVTLVAGGNTVYVRAVDGNNNWAYANRQLYLDNQAPTVAIATPASGTAFTVNTVTVTGTATDNMLIAKIEVQLGTGAWVTATGTTAWTLANLTLTQGSNTITVRATDTAGNSNTTQTTVTVDSQAPAVSIGSPTEGAKLTKDKVKLSGTASDNVRLVSIEVTVNGVAVTVTGLNIWYVNITLKEGKNNITVSATDSAGLKTSQTISVTYTKPKPQPGFELVFLIGAVAIGLALLGRKRN